MPKTFADLPKELQLLVWKYALPDPHEIEGAIILFVDFDLSQPRAILPQITEYKDAYHRARTRYNEVHHDDSEEEDEAESLWGFNDTHLMANHRSPVMNLLQACRASRTVALEVFRLDLASSIPEEQIPWWSPADDMVYFAQPDNYIENRAMLYWLSQRREVAQSNLSSLQHIAFRFDHNISTALDPTSFADAGYDNVLYTEDGWLLNFPDLQSLSIFIDPVMALKDGVGERKGKIILHEPEDVTVHSHRGLKPSQIEESIARNFESLVKRGRGKKAPLVECFVVGVKTRWKKKTRRMAG